MSGAQLAMIAFIAMELGIQLAKNGEPRVGTYSFGWQLVSWAIVVAILWWGGFWS